MRTLLTLIGLALQVVGLIVTGWGVLKTWRAYGEEPFWSYVTGPVVEVSGRVAARVGKLFGRRRPARVVGMGSVVQAEFSATARARLGFGDLPENDEAAFAELDRRTKGLLTQVQDLAENLQDRVEALEGALAVAQEQVAKQAQELRTSDKNIAVGGIRTESVGLLLIGLGVVAQGIGSLL